MIYVFLSLCAVLYIYEKLNSICKMMIFPAIAFLVFWIGYELFFYIEDNGGAEEVLKHYIEEIKGATHKFR